MLSDRVKIDSLISILCLTKTPINKFMKLSILSISHHIVLTKKMIFINYLINFLFRKKRGSVVLGKNLGNLGFSRVIFWRHPCACIGLGPWPDEVATAERVWADLLSVKVVFGGAMMIVSPRPWIATMEELSSGLGARL